jgi:hypothetical protein
MGDMADYYREQALDLRPGERALVPQATADAFFDEDEVSTPNRAPTDAVIQNEFADQLSEMLGPTPGAHGVPFPVSAPAPAPPRGWDEEDRTYPEVRASNGQSTFPIKQKLKALGCKWSQKRNAWVAPTHAVHAQGVRLANTFWAQNPNADPWTLEGDPQPQPAQQAKRKRTPKPRVDVVIVDELSDPAKEVQEKFTAMAIEAAVRTAPDTLLADELERRGWQVRKIPESVLLREALAAEGETGDHLLAATDDIFDELEQEEE